MSDNDPYSVMTITKNVKIIFKSNITIQSENKILSLEATLNSKNITSALVESKIDF